MIKVTINGKEIELEKQVTILEAARQGGIKIPTLCHHEGLEVYGGCRLCLVEIEKVPRLQTSCTTMVTDGMVVTTENDQIAAARKAMLEFILTNHPLDCPFCDKAGECELQDLVYLYGGTEGRFAEPKPKHPESNVDPILTRNIERCIACTRCVRMCEGAQGAQKIAMVNRGHATQMEPFSGGTFECEYCGNCLTVCPVGSILSRLYKDSYRPWQVERTVNTVCGYCGVGCSFDIQVRDEAIKRVLPRIPQGLNKGLLCVRGRFGYEYVDSPDRLTVPLVRRNGKLEETTWTEALDLVAEKLGAIRSASGGTAIAGIASTRCTNEDNYVFQKFMRGVIGTNHIDSTARLGFAGAQMYLESLRGQGVTANLVSGIREADVILIVGGDPTAVTPVLGLQIRAAARKGARVVSLDAVPGLDHFFPLRIVPDLFAENVVLEGLVSGLAGQVPMSGELPHLEDRIKGTASISAEEAARSAGVEAASMAEAVQVLLGAQSLAIVVGKEIIQRKDGHRGLFFIGALSYLKGGRIFLLADRPNEQGVIDMGCVPDTLPGGRPLLLEGFRKRYEEACGLSVPDFEGLTLVEMIPAMAEGRIKGLYVMGENPAFNIPDGAGVTAALDKLDFLVVQDIFLTETARLADVVLPALSWAERDGSYTNLERRIQAVRRGVRREGKEDWRIITEVSSRMGTPMDFQNAGDILSEIARVSPVHRDLHAEEVESGRMVWPYHGEPLRGESASFTVEAGSWKKVPGGETVLLVDRPLFSSGTIIRKAAAIGKLHGSPLARMHPSRAVQLGAAEGGKVRLTANGVSVVAEVRLDAFVPEGAVRLSNHFEGSGVFAMMSPAGLDPVTKAPALEGCRVKVELHKGDQ